MEQLVARRAHNPKVTGSSPVPATTKDTGNGILFLFFINSQEELYSPQLLEVLNKLYESNS